MVKTLSLMILILAMIISAGLSYCADLKWDASTGDVEGYNVYFNSGEDEFHKDVGNVTEVLDIDTSLNLYPGKIYTATVKAYNAKGESDPSNSVEYTSPKYIPPDDVLPPVIIVLPESITIRFEQ